jgi:hypothetical protein
LLSKLLWWPAPVNTTTFNVAFQPKQVIGQTLDYVSKLGWAIAAGPGNSPDEIGADMAFSFIPVVGVYSDIRDSAAELLKLWPGGESPDWTAFGFAVVGILTEITPADVALDVAKGFVKAAKANIINPTGVLFKTVITEFKTLGPRVVSAAGQSASAVLKEIQDTVNFISDWLPPLWGGTWPVTVHGGYAMKFLDSLVKTERDIPVIRTMNSVFTNLPQALAGFATKFGSTQAAQNIVSLVGGLGKPLQQALANGNKLDVVAEGIAKGGWNQINLEQYAQFFQGVDQALVSKFDNWVDIPGSGSLTEFLDPAKNNSLLAVLTYADNAGKGSVLEFSRPIYKNADVVTDIDIVTTTKFVSVKSNINSDTKTELEDVVTALVNEATQKGVTPVLAYFQAKRASKESAKGVRQAAKGVPGLAH